MPDTSRKLSLTDGSAPASTLTAVVRVRSASPETRNMVGQFPLATGLSACSFLWERAVSFITSTS